MHVLFAILNTSIHMKKIWVKIRVVFGEYPEVKISVYSGAISSFVFESAYRHLNSVANVSRVVVRAS